MTAGNVSGAPAIATPMGAILDDSGTVVVAPSLRMRWHQLVPGRGFDNTVDGQTQVSVHLATAPWVGRRARIYMALGRGTGPVVHATWSAGGAMLGGSVVSGSRALVFNGLIRAAALTDTLQLTLTTDGRQLTTSVKLDFKFQIEPE